MNIYALAGHLTHLARGNFEVVPSEIEHIEQIDLVGTEVRGARNAPAALRKQVQHGVGMTAIKDGEIIGIVGVVMIREHFGECWFVPTKKLKDETLAMVRCTRAFIAYTMQSLQLTRLQACVKTTDKTSLAYASYAGFERECTMRKYGVDGEDYDLMSIVR